MRKRLRKPRPNRNNKITPNIACELPIALASIKSCSTMSLSGLKGKTEMTLLALDKVA